MELVSKVQNLNKAVCSQFHVNALLTSMNASLFPSAMGKEESRLASWFGYQSRKMKTQNSNQLYFLLKIELVNDPHMNDFSHSIHF